MNKLLLVILLCLAACSQQDLIDRFSSRQEQAFAIQAATDVHDGRGDKLVAMSEGDIRSGLEAYVAKVQPLLAQVPPPYKIQTVNVLSSANGLNTKTFVLKGGADDHWALISVVLHIKTGEMHLAGLNVTLFSVDPANAVYFTLNQRGALGFLFLAVMIICTGSCILAVVLVWRDRTLKRRWLWTFGSLWGFIGFSLNWSTGAWGVGLNISLLGVNATKAGPFAPWLLSFGIPVIAWLVIYRWFRRPHLDRAPFE